MKKHLLKLIAILFVLALLVPCTLTAQEDDSPSYRSYRRVKVQLVSSSRVAWGRLYINGRYRGRVRRSSSRTFRLRAGRSHTFEMRRTYAGTRYKRFRSVYISSSSSVKWVFLAPIAQSSSNSSGRGYVNLILSVRSKVAWANLTINGKSFGRLRRGYSRKRKFWLKTGMRHRIVVRRVWRGNIWRKTSYVRVYEGQTKTLYLVPINIGGGSSNNNSSYRTIKAKLTSTSKVAWARLYVNGRYKGKVRRSRYLSFRLASGQTYRFKAVRVWRGQRYQRDKSVYLSSSSSSTKTVFLHPYKR